MSMASEETAPVLPTPPASPTTADHNESLKTSNISLTETAKALDSLLEQYLNLLDRQQQLQGELGKQFSSGFFSLARANHSCPPGRRYGEDYYDERMKASRKISIGPQPSISRDTISETKTCANESTNDVSSPLSFSISRAETLSNSKQSTADGLSNENADKTASVRDTISEKSPKLQERSSSEPPNPITWFGILVPPALRLAQSSFVSAVEGPIPALVNVTREMRQVEDRVRRMRVILNERKVADENGR